MPPVHQQPLKYFSSGRAGWSCPQPLTLSPEDKEQFVKMVAELSKSGYLGYQEFIVNHKVERHEVVSQIGDERLRNAHVFDRGKHPHY